MQKLVRTFRLEIFQHISEMKDCLLDPHEESLGKKTSYQRCKVWLKPIIRRDQIDTRLQKSNLVFQRA